MRLTLIHGGLVVTMDALGTVLEDGGVAVRGSEIVAVGPSDRLRQAYAEQAAEQIDAAGMLVMPGLVNTHTHAGDALFRGLFDDLPLEPWLERLWVVERRFLSPATVRVGSRLAYAEMIRGGTTTALDMFWFPEAAAAVAKEIGLRLLTGPIYFDSDQVDGLSAEERTARGRELIAEYRDDPLITPCVLPHATYTVSPHMLAEAAELAGELGILFSTHASETATEVRTVRERHGRTPPRHLDALGILDERCILAHGVHLSDDEIDLLAERRTVLAHCPLSNLKLGSGIAPVPRMRSAGVRLGLGTDGPVSGNDLDLWHTLRLTAVLHKGTHQDPSLLAAEEVVRLATCDAAAALGMADRIGSLEPGKRADLILVDLDQLHSTPRYDVYSHLVYAAGRDDVSTAMIDGRVVMRDRRLLSVDEEETIEAVRQVAREVAAWEG